MTRHVLKLVWNRKRSNVLIAIEVLLSFIVLCAVTTLAVFYVDNYRKPLGFEVDRLWTISVESHASGGRTSTTIQSDGSDQASAARQADRARIEQRQKMAQLLLALRDLPEVETVAAASITPYSGNTWTSDIEIAGKRHRYGADAATDGFARTMGLEITRGRWFSHEDDAAAWRPVVVNERLAREVFPGADPVGQFMAEQPPPGTAANPADRMRVVGVIREFRKDGEYAAPENFVFERVRFDDARADAAEAREFVIRVRPGTTAAFEARAVAALRRAAPEWTFQAEALTQSRDTALQYWLAPLTAAAVVSLFLLVMVAMGLSGVLWLHVTQRTREIGLRRAKGATVVNIRRQLVGEVAVLTGIATLVGVAIVVQFPLLQVFSAVSPFVYGASLAISLVCIFLLTMACAWTPARMASVIQPADALRYE
jgi:putative ABC transport system permease protein